MATVSLVKPQREDIPEGDVLCQYCTGKCCRYFALPIETPEAREDFEFVRWYMLHGETTIFREDDDYYLMVHNVCDHLQSDNRCGIYETRPEICRAYTTDNCEYEDDWTYDSYWETPEQLSEYMEAILPPKKRKSIRSLQPELLPVLS